MDKDAKWLAWFEQRFTEVAGTDRQIDFDEFKRALNVTQVSEPACVVTITITKRCGRSYVTHPSLYLFHVEYFILQLITY